MATNRYGLDTNYFKKELKVLGRDASNYTPVEMYRALTRLAEVAKPTVKQIRSEIERQRQNALKHDFME